jgi:hypothetical protein
VNGPSSAASRDRSPPVGSRARSIARLRSSRRTAADGERQERPIARQPAVPARDLRVPVST